MQLLHQAAIGIHLVLHLNAINGEITIAVPHEPGPEFDSKAIYPAGGIKTKHSPH